MKLDSEAVDYCPENKTSYIHHLRNSKYKENKIVFFILTNIKEAEVKGLVDSGRQHGRLSDNVVHTKLRHWNKIPSFGFDS